MAKSKIIIGYYVADLVVNVTKLPVGDFKDWPSNIQEGLIEAMEKLDKRTGRTYEMSNVYAADDGDGPYIWITARAPRYIGDPPPGPKDKVVIH